MSNIRDILNRIKWTKDIDKISIWYVHRGAPDDTKILDGSEIIHVGRSFLETKSASIPFHRILKIVYDDEVLFDRKTMK